jgi:hypothetical protein
VSAHHRWDHHPPCPGGCGQLADECECRRIARGLEPKAIEHLCARDLLIQPGAVEDCCINEWRDHGCEP